MCGIVDTNLDVTGFPLYQRKRTNKSIATLEKGSSMGDIMKGAFGVRPLGDFSNKLNMIYKIEICQCIYQAKRNAA